MGSAVMSVGSEAVCRVAHRELPPAATSVREARQFLGDVIDRWEINDLRGDLLLAVSELVTNGINHARTHLVLDVVLASGVIELVVHDKMPAMLALPTSNARLDPTQLPATIGGRGLQIVGSISDAWGVVISNTAPVGKAVWLTKAIPSGWAHLDSCVCASSGSERTTSTGRAVTHINGPWDG
jgi:anti-sigma regulatory factor (Ser/Thr protein kinase)